MSQEDMIDEAVVEFSQQRHVFQRFLNGVIDSFTLEPKLNEYGKPVLHSIKHRLKDEEHLKQKLKRKWDPEDPITSENIFQKITDLAGVRVLHLHQDQLPIIHDFIMDMVAKGDWTLNEDPVAYS